MISNLEKRIRKLRRDFFIASGVEKMEGNSVLVLSKDIWDQYLEENENIKIDYTKSDLNKVTFESVMIMVLTDLPQVTDLICYLPTGTVPKEMYNK